MEGTDGAFTMEEMSTGRSWGIVYDDDSSPQVRAAAAVSGGISYKIAELPRAGASANLKLVTNAEDMRRCSSRAAVAMPSLARSCIACGATPDKLRICGACKQVAYCSKEVRALLAAACRFQRFRARPAHPSRFPRLSDAGSARAVPGGALAHAQGAVPPDAGQPVTASCAMQALRRADVSARPTRVAGAHAALAQPCGARRARPDTCTRPIRGSRGERLQGRR